jgi:APA family basic amino acid/polyamine antiporter
MHESPQLRRVLKAHHLFALSFGTIVGTGWITGLGIWLGLAGSLGSIVGFALGGVVMILIALCYAQLALRYPRAGGEITYAYHMWGLDVSFATGWCMVLIYVTAIAFQAVALAWMLEVLVTPAVRGPQLYTALGEPVYLTATLVALAIGAFIAWLNHRGVSGMARFQSGLTFGKIAISLVFFACALPAGDFANLEPRWSADAGGFSSVGLWAVFATAPFFLAGFDVVPLAMGEKSANTSGRAVYIAIVGSLIAAVAYYALVILSASMILPREELLAAELPTVAAFERAFGSALLAKVVLVAGLMGVLTCWNSSVFAAGRVLYSMGESRMIPAWFGRLHPTFATPGRAALFSSCVGLLLLPFGKAVILPIVNAAGSCIALVALIVSVGLMRLHLRGGAEAATVGQIRGGWVTVAAACLGSAFIVVMAFYEAWRSSAGKVPLEWLIFGAWIVLGAGFWFSTRHSRNSISEEERRARLGAAVVP